MRAAFAKGPPPEWVVRLWPQLVAASREIGGWAGDYSGGYIDDGGLPDLPPDAVGRKVRDEMNGKGIDPPVEELYVGDFAMFRLHELAARQLDAGYEDTAGTENERFVADGEYRVVVYML